MFNFSSVKFVSNTHTAITGYEDSMSECMERASKSTGTKKAFMFIRRSPLGLMGKGFLGS